MRMFKFATVCFAPIDSGFTAEESAAFAEHGVNIDPVRDEQGRFAPAEETVTAPVAADTLTGGQGADALLPAQGADTLVGGQAADALPPQGFVPHAALHAERAQRQELARQNALLMARTNALLTRQAPEAPAALPDLNQDPEGYIRGLEDRLASFENVQREQQVHRDMDTRLEQDEASFVAYTPDYGQASEYYVQSRAQELLQFYTPQQAQAIMQDEIRAVAKQSWERGMPAAASIYNLAQARGFRPGQPSPFAYKTTPTSPQATVAAQPAPQPTQQAAPTPAAVVDSVLAGQQASRSLSGGVGATPKDVNAEALLKMSDDEFEAYLQLGTKGGNARFAAIAGG